MKRKKRKSPEENLLITNKEIFLSLFTPPQSIKQLEASICFARYLNSIGLNRRNYKIFLKMMETNNRWVIDSLIGERDPILLFSTIKPNKFLIKEAFRILTFFHPKEVNKKLLLAILGILQAAYYSADDGYKIYMLTIADLDNLGKFLDSEKDQFDEINKMVLEVLDRISRLGFYNWTHQKSILSKHAFDIRFGYFDNRKKLKDIIPEVLLIKIERREVSPSQKFIEFLEDSNL